MKERDAYAELSSIRDLMERSSKFISLTGLSGILTGIYALAGAVVAYHYDFTFITSFNSSGTYSFNTAFFRPFLLTGLIVLILSIATVTWLTIRKAHKKGEQVWNPVSKRMLFAAGVPLFSGGLFILILMLRGEYSIIFPACLIFYGLSLVAGSHYTFTDVKLLGLCEILLGLLALFMPNYGLILWALGFGILHIVYGTIMHFKYDR
jgi:hypothetical protein